MWGKFYLALVQGAKTQQSIVAISCGYMVVVNGESMGSLVPRL